MKHRKNMRLIDANALKEHISSFAGRFTEGGGFEISMDAVLGAIDFAKGVDAEPVRRWISVDDKLPEDGNLVLVICDGQYMMARYNGLRWSAGTDGCTTILIEPGDVTHWMSLPKKPIIKGEEK